MQAFYSYVDFAAVKDSVGRMRVSSGTGREWRVLAVGQAQVILGIRIAQGVSEVFQQQHKAWVMRVSSGTGRERWHVSTAK